ncbi:MAG: hypothetical protein HZA28_00745 [Candidatus Omnitrophica bacterium]|nr:hypothetical protein [Candidatus Omnitrophota bacterium]
MTPPEYIAAAILSGFKDSLNPYMFSGIMCCMLFLVSIPGGKRQLILAGRCVSAAVFLTTFMLAQGTNLLLLVPPVVVAVIRLISLAFAVVLIVTGYIFLRQWWVAKKGRQEQGVLKFHQLNSSFKIICSSAILGVLVAVINMLWPKNTDFYLAYFILLTSGDFFRIALYLFSYSAAFIGYLALGCWLTVTAVNSTKFQKILANALSMARITCSAVCMALGMGLIFLYNTAI